MSNGGVVTVSAQAESVVGHEISYTRPDGKVITGICQAVRPSGSVIRDLNGEEWPGVQFKVKPSNGKRALWTVTLPDQTEENREGRGEA